MRQILLLCMLAAPLAARDPLAARIVHLDPSKFHRSPAVHGGAGALNYTALFGSDVFNTNLIFLHRGVLEPKSGIGHHFHNQCEEMFVIFDGEAQFTIDGRTSLLKGPAGALCRMGHSHAIYNATDKPIEWMNINVGSVKGKYDAFNLDDARVGVPLDPIPVFMTMRLDRILLKPDMRRRTLEPSVFETNWSYADHLLLKPGSKTPRERHTGVEEFYYVMAGDGTVHVNNESAPIHKTDTVPVFLNDVHSFENTGSQDLELFIVGIARQKNVLDTEKMP